MDKLKALQDFMVSKGLGALLIPRTDEFQGEYLGAYAERLQWLTGFTGTAGFAVITPTKAAFFTDGRYLLQAKEEVPSNYEHHSLLLKTPAQWVSENLRSHEKVGFDPWLFTENQIGRYKNTLVPLSINPIDTLWKDKPLPPQGLVSIHPLEYAGETSQSKRTKICGFLKSDYVLLTSCDSIAWLLNIRGNDVPHTPLVHSFCLLHKDGSYVLFVDERKVIDEVSSYINGMGGRIIPINSILSHLSMLKGGCQIDPQTTPLILTQTLEEGGVKVIRERDPCILPKAIKNGVEIQGMVQAHIQDGIALCKFFAWLENQSLVGETTEVNAAEKLHEFRKKGQRFKDLSFETISSFGHHGAIVHYRATPESDIPLKGDGLYLVDSGGQYLTGTTDVTRTICLGTPTDEQKDRYTRVLKGHIAISQIIFPKGTAGIQLDALARQYLWQIGADYDHGTGHGVGSYLSVHEGPQRLSKWVANEPLRAGMVLSNEPGYYKEGEYGIRIENLVYVKEVPNLENFYQFEPLTLVPFDLKLIEPSLLTVWEKEWIENYHRRIYETLSPYVDIDTKKWLEKNAMIYF